MFPAGFKNIRTILKSWRFKNYQQNFHQIRCLSSSWNFHQEHWNFTQIALFFTSAVGFSIFDNKNFTLFPRVKAAVPTSGSALNLEGRRKQFNFIADVVAVASPALVYIEIKDTRRVDYFTGKPVTVSNGSGFLVESDGLLITNAHVVVNKPHSAVNVKLHDGRTFHGVVEAVDPISDLATVRINCKNLPVMKLGKSSSLRPGEFVVALGSPLNLQQTVTAGVVSAERPSSELGLQGRDINYIQTDAAITFGNSGGPLVNLEGEAIGINSMTASPGISFAIPMDYAKEFLRKAKERVKRGSAEPVSIRRYIGITMLSLTPEILTELKQRGSNIPDFLQNGILVWKVIIGSPAHQGGLLAGDIILAINDAEVKKSSDIYQILEQKTKTLNMIVLRNGKQLRITVIPEDPA